MKQLKIVWKAVVLQILLGDTLASICLNSWDWNGWGACSVSCGGGFRVRHCYRDGTHETERCGTTCYNGAEFYSGQCHCRHGTLAPCCVDIKECASNPCQNEGTCNEMVNIYTCTCPPGTTGDNCIDIPECASNPCKNGGTCEEHVNYYTCNCPLGTTGHDCVDIPECLSNPCLNGGTCVDYVGGYTCQCPPGTTGIHCTDIPECASNPCMNGGTCNEMINMYNCTCTQEYTGVNCEKYLFSHYDNTCRVDGSCYVIFRVKDTWEGSRDFCRARNGHLAVPENEAEMLFIETFLESMRTRYAEALFWIGGQKTSLTVQWLPGYSSTVSRWPDGRSLPVIGTECMAMDGRYNFEWQTFPCDRPTFFVCEEDVLFNTVGVVG
ncbi:fibropellin-3-like [Mya arenaria]|uniref:fibropellin-3-like n=1 Tax=Mya arenaria TaxID=6604 RepID=UPI0022E26382|nr:fibropellin-3-like [Mya arenaria]